jgi:hypothetical protein
MFSNQNIVCTSHALKRNKILTSFTVLHLDTPTILDKSNRNYDYYNYMLLSIRLLPFLVKTLNSSASFARETSVKNRTLGKIAYYWKVS